MGSTRLKWEMSVGMMNGELLIIVVVRIVMGLSLALAFSFLGSVMVRMNSPLAFFPVPGLFASVTTLLIGASAGLGATLAWWIPESPRSVSLLFAAFAIVTGALSGWIGFQLFEVGTRLVWVSGTGLVPFIDLEDALFAPIIPTIVPATIGGNAVAGVFYLYRALLHRET